MTIAIRDIVAADLDRVVDLDRRLTGHPRKGFHEKRLTAASAEPGSFITLGTADERGLVAYAFAHILDGEFGGAGPVGVLDALGVVSDRRGQGLARALMESVERIMRERGVKEIISQAAWTDHAMISFFHAAGFRLAPRLVLERSTANGLDFDVPINAPPHSTEINLSDPSGDDVLALSRDRIPVRSMTEADFPFIVAVDRKVTGRDRSAYYRRKVAEVLRESGVRVSLVAELDGQFAGFVMARVDFGEFGRAQAAAVLDTIGIDPAFKRRNVGRALISQLLTNLGSLRVEQVQTQVAWNSFGLLSFLERSGFSPAQQLTFSSVLHRKIVA